MLPKIDTIAATPVPPVTPARTEVLSQSTAPLSKVASELRRVTGKSTETYTAYGVTERLFKDCAKQAEYFIPQASDENVEMPKTADGEDLGVGEGWWHTGDNSQTGLRLGGC